jgi:hypothetical protein
MGVGGQRHAPAVLPPRNTRYPVYKRLREPHGRSERVRKISSTTGFEPRTVQPVASPLTQATPLRILQFQGSVLWSVGVEVGVAATPKVCKKTTSIVILRPLTPITKPLTL